MMKKSVTAILLMTILNLPAYAGDSDSIVGWKRDTIHVFSGPNHQTMTATPKSDLPPTAIIEERADPLLGFTDPKTRQKVFVNKSEVITRSALEAVKSRQGDTCVRAYGQGFTNSC